MAFVEYEAYDCTAGSTPKSIGSFIDDNQTNKHWLNKVTYVAIGAYAKDGDTARGAIDYSWRTDTVSEIKQPILAGQPAVWDGMSWGASNNIKLERAGGSDVAFVLIVGYEK
jgi:hypothetical protein